MEEEWTGNRVRKLRKRLRLTQTEFGMLIWDVGEGTAQTNVSRIERDEVKPSAAVRKTLARLESAVKHVEDGPVASVMARVLFPELISKLENEDAEEEEED